MSPALLITLLLNQTAPAQATGAPSDEPTPTADTTTTTSAARSPEPDAVLKGLDVASSLRAAFPTSIASRNAGLIASLGLGFIFERKFFERFSVGYAIRPTKYFYSRMTGGIARLDANGGTIFFDSTGVPNADYGFINGFWAGVDLPKGFA